MTCYGPLITRTAPYQHRTQWNYRNEHKKRHQSDKTGFYFERLHCTHARTRARHTVPSSDGKNATITIENKEPTKKKTIGEKHSKNKWQTLKPNMRAIQTSRIKLVIDTFDRSTSRSSSKIQVTNKIYQFRIRTGRQRHRPTESDAIPMDKSCGTMYVSMELRYVKMCRPSSAPSVLDTMYVS